jgi:hypothetical protein
MHVDRGISKRPRVVGLEVEEKTMKRAFTGLLAVALGGIAVPLASAGTDLSTTARSAVGPDRR